MFTGLIEELGTIQKVVTIPQGKEFTISANLVLEELQTDDSVAINGVCLTATGVGEDTFEATAVRETLEKTTLGTLKRGTMVNLERALRMSDRLGGHLVQGHVDARGAIVGVIQEGAGHLVRVRVPRLLLKYIIEKGSIAVDGISLTVARIQGDHVEISVIPHTWEKTNLPSLSTGTDVNIEVDMIGKYVERMLGDNDAKNMSWYKKMGY